MDVVVRSNNNPVNDMTAPVSWLINIDIDIDIRTKHRLVAFKRPIIFIYFDSHCRFMDILAAKFQY